MKRRSGFDALGDKADGLDAYFVTVDPTRDTAAVMQDYLRPFDSRIRAITGTESQIAELIKGWNVYAKTVPLEGGGSQCRSHRQHILDEVQRYVAGYDRVSRKF